MKIIKKELITKMRVEITKDEFINVYDELMVDAYHLHMDSTPLNKEKIKRYNEVLDSNGKYGQAEESFKSIFGLTHSAVIKKIADRYNMIVENYGYHDGEVIIAVFMQYGDRM